MSVRTAVNAKFTNLKLFTLTLIALLAIFASISLASSCQGDVCSTNNSSLLVSPNPVSNDNSSGVNVWFFYASWCPHCHRVLSSGILNNVSKYAKVYYYEVDTNSTARDLFNQVVQHYNIPAGVPTAIVFTNNPMSGTVLQGDQSIISDLLKLVESNAANQHTNSSVVSAGGVTHVSRDLLSDLVFLVGVAASDSINPCIMAVMLIMLATLASIKEYKRMRLFGIVYILCVYLSYLAIGVLLILGSMYLVNQLSMFATQLATATKWVVAAILVIAGIINIKDFFFWGKGITFNINDKHKQKVIELAKKASIFAVVSIAAFVTLVEFPCSGIMYLGAIFYWVSQGVNPYQIFAYLLLYNVIFVLPLVIMLWVALMGRKAEEGDVSKARDILMRNKEKFRLIMGVALLGLAYLVLFG